MKCANCTNAMTENEIRFDYGVTVVYICARCKRGEAITTYDKPLEIVTVSIEI